MAEGIFDLLKSHDARLFAAMIPCKPKPKGAPLEFLRKDQVFLFERYFYFLEHNKETGLLVMDGTDKAADRRFARQAERYFTRTQSGRQRTTWIVPSPLFVESDMAYGVQVADVCIYCLNWGLRLNGMTATTRKEIEPFAWLAKRLVWSGDGYRDGRIFTTHSIVYVPDPYENR